MKLNIGNTLTHFICESAQEYAQLKHNLTCKVKGYQYSKLYKKKVWDGNKTLTYKNKTEERSGFFLSGLLPLASHGKILNPCETFENIDFAIGDIELRDYQKIAVQKILENKRGIIDLAPNAGKTEIMICAVKNLVEKRNLNVLILQKGISLCQQTFQRFKRVLGDKVGILQGDNVDIKQVTICSIDTLYNVRDKITSTEYYKELNKIAENYAIKDDYQNLLFSANAVFLDECHLATSNGWQVVMSKCCNAQYRIGLSGTPYDDDDKLRNLILIGHTGIRLMKVTSQDLVKTGISAKCTVKICNWKYYDSGHEHFQDVLAREFIENKARVAHIIEQALSEGDKRYLIMSNYVRNAEIAHNYLLEKGFDCVFIQGKTAKKERAESLKKKIVVATTVADVGLDLDVDVIVLLCPGSKANRIIQRIGRGQRRKRGKSEFVLYDCFDKNIIREVSNAWGKKDKITKFENQFKKRLKVYETQGHEVISLE